MDGKIIAGAAALVVLFSAGFAFFGMGTPDGAFHDGQGMGFMRGMPPGNGTMGEPMMEGEEFPPCDGDECPGMPPTRYGVPRGNWSMEAPPCFADGNSSMDCNRMHAGMNASEVPEMREECKEAMEGEEVSSLMEDIRSAMQERDFEYAKELREEMGELMPDGCMPTGYGMPGRMNAPGSGARQMHGMPEECRESLESEEVSSLVEELHSALESGDTGLATELKEEIEGLMPDGCAGFPLAHGIGGARGCSFSEDEAS